MESTKNISVIICTYDHASLLEKCLNSLLTQSPADLDFEVLIIDSSPNDETQKLVRQYTNRQPPIRYYFEEKLGHSVARNRGHHEAKGEYLVYLDDDATIPEDYLKNVSRVISMHSPDILGGPVYPIYTAAIPWWFSDEFEIRKYANQSGFSMSCGISGGNFIIRKSVLESMGLFDENYGMRAGRLGMLDERKLLETYRDRTAPEEQKVYYSLECYVNHYTADNKLRLTYLLRRAYISGSALFQMYLDISGHPNKRKGNELILRGIEIILYDGLKMMYKNGIYIKRYVNVFIEGITRIVKGIGYYSAQVRFYLRSKFIQ